MGKEIFIAVGAFAILLASYFMLKSKAKFQNEIAARLIFFRSVVGMVFITIIYYFVLVWRSYSIPYLSIVVISTIILIIIDHQIKKVATRAH